MRIRGADNLTPAQLAAELAAGGRLVFFEYCISFVLLTLRCPTGLVLLRPGESGVVRGLPYTLLSLLFGWWGIPMGIIYTPLTLVTNLSGGCDVTDEVRMLLGGERMRHSDTPPDGPAE
ncbi:MAG TPA: hypothetical protein VJ739_17645 [Gemmataceae bacterium]|nr:hypothetical protein [Gemmataceae bacterium]